MPFPNASFELVYSYHVLEHIPDYNTALAEINRVLKSGGILFIGTPNRSRIIGYISGDSNLREKIAWNYDDWKYRLKGKFKNEFGAHAGYTSKELIEILSKIFLNVDEISKKYYQTLYKSKLFIVNILYKFNIARLLFPAVYFVAEKKAN